MTTGRVPLGAQTSQGLWVEVEGEPPPGGGWWRRFVIGSFVFVIPSTTWLIRHLNSRLDRDGEEIVIEAALTAKALGLGEHAGRHAPFLPALDSPRARLRPHRPDPHDETHATREVTLLVRRLLPPLSDRLADRLPPSLAEQHRRYDSTIHADEAPLLRHARLLARTHRQLQGQNDKEAS